VMEDPNKRVATQESRFCADRDRRHLIGDYVQTFFRFHHQYNELIIFVQPYFGGLCRRALPNLLKNNL
jgi:hypothetical protein